MVTDPGRTFNPCTNVGTANGLWTFGHLMTQMANQAATGIAPPDFARSWLAQWETPQTVNSFTIPARANIVSRIVQPWLAASGGTTLDMTKAPFRLLAIVNRLDLRQNLIYGGGSAGEARFVFGAVDLTNNCAPLPFSVIFEYGITKNSCQQVKEWGKQWYALRTLDPTTLRVPGSARGDHPAVRRRRRGPRAAAESRTRSISSARTSAPSARPGSCASSRSCHRDGSPR